MSKKRRYFYNLALMLLGLAAFNICFAAPATPPASPTPQAQASTTKPKKPASKTHARKPISHKKITAHKYKAKPTATKSKATTKAPAIKAKATAKPAVKSKSVALNKNKSIKTKTKKTKTIASNTSVSKHSRYHHHSTHQLKSLSSQSAKPNLAASHAPSINATAKPSAITASPSSAISSNMTSAAPITSSPSQITADNNTQTNLLAPSNQIDLAPPHQNVANPVVAQNNNQDLIANNFNSELHQRLTSDRNAACETAKAQIGIPYQWGGEEPDGGFDCSGLSQFVYQQEGITIPRTALEQYHSLLPVKHLQEGDLVFFRTDPPSRRVSHVGIYIGDGYFVDSPRTGQAVRVDRLDNPYWKSVYAGARRVLTPKKVENQKNPLPQVASASPQPIIASEPALSPTEQIADQQIQSPQNPVQPNINAASVNPQASVTPAQNSALAQP